MADRVVESWDGAPPKTGDAGRAAIVWAELRRDHPVEEIRTGIFSCIADTGNRMWTGASVDRAQMQRTDRCLRMTLQIGELDPGPDVTSEFVLRLNCILASNLVSPHVAHHLSAVQLFDTLAPGVRDAPDALARASCLDAVRSYYPVITRSSDPVDFERALRSLEKEVRRTEEVASSYSPDDASLLRESATNARKTLQGIRRRRLDIPRHTAREFKAYRVEEGSNAFYVVEWLDDGPAAIVTRVEVEERKLRVEYRCDELALLPEDVPAVLEDALLHRYGHDEFAGRVDEVVYQDTRSTETTTRPYPAR